MQEGDEMNLTEMKKAAAVLLVCVFGMIIIQLAAPFILGIVVQGAALIVPLAAYHFFIRKGWRLRLDRGQDSKNFEAEGSRNEEYDEKHSNEENAGKETDIHSESSEHADGKTETALSETEQQTVRWYEEQGRERIFSIIRRLSGKGICDCWIRKDGICSAQKDGNYRRSGAIPGFGDISAKMLIRLLQKDQIPAESRGRYLYLSWDIEQEE